MAAADIEAEPAGHVPERDRVLDCSESKESCRGTTSKFLGLVMNGPDTAAERHGDTDGANAAQARGGTLQGGRRRPKPAPLSLTSFVPRITAPSLEGKASGKDRADASGWPTFVVLTPIGLSAEVERSAQNASANQETDSHMLPIRKDESSEPRSFSTLPIV